MYLYRNPFEVLCAIRFSNYCLTINTYVVLEFLAIVHIVHEWSGLRFRAIAALGRRTLMRLHYTRTTKICTVKLPCSRQYRRFFPQHAFRRRS